jgi:hypothetical protein
LLLGLEQLRRDVHPKPNRGSYDSIGNPGRQHIRPGADRLQRNADSPGRMSRRPKKFDRSPLEHADKLVMTKFFCQPSLIS